MMTETLRMVYCAFFHTVINYEIVAWGGAYYSTVRMLQNLQNRILKIVNKNNFVTQDENPMNPKQQLFVNHYVIIMIHSKISS